MNPKPFCDYAELVDLLEQKGMHLPDRNRAQRKLSQVGYYRLSGFWYSCRKPNPGSIHNRLDEFLPNTSFDELFKLYLLDKRLRLLLLDAIERIEVRLKAVVAHELGKQNPMAYTDIKFINHKQLKDFYRQGKNVIAGLIVFRDKSQSFRVARKIALFIMLKIKCLSLLGWQWKLGHLVPCQNTLRC